jgi:hypothetical protein
MYQLIIHHDIGLSKQNQQFITDGWNLGHVYLELKGNDDSAVYGIESGWNESKIKYFEYRPHDKERLDRAREYESQHPNEKILHSKTINIKEIQYLEAMVLLDDYEQYIGKKMPSEIYSLFGNNCAHFVNHIYRSMGLEGDYTRSYRASELNEINTVLTNTYKAVLGFYPGDKALTVFGLSIEEVAKKYNVDVSKVTKKELTQQGVPDMEIAMMQEACDQISFEIAPNHQLFVEEQSFPNQQHADFLNSLNSVYNSDSFKGGQEAAKSLIKESTQHLDEFQQQHGEWLTSISPSSNLPGFMQGQKFVQNLTKQGFSHTQELMQAMGFQDTTPPVFNPFQQFGVQTMGESSSFRANPDNEHNEDIN